MKQSRGAETHDRARAVHFQEESVASVTSTTGTTSAKKGVWSRLRTALSKRKAASSTVTQQAEADPQGSPGPSERTPPVNEAVELRAQDAVGRIPMANGTLPLKSFTTFDDLWSRISDSSIPSDSEGHQLMRDWSGRLKEGEWIGGGGFGDVYKGIWENLSNIDPTSVPVVVVKVIQQRALWKHEKRSVKLFNREIKICLQLQHPNIVSFIGVVFGFGHSQKSELPALISLYMPNGTVKAYLKNQDEPPPLHMFLEIAKGIKYLHTFNPLIVHGDIKAENILVDDRGRLRVTDFGLSRMIVDQADWATTALEAPGTDRWMAPELLEGTQTTVTKESDIYALGMTFLEMRTRDLPFSQYKNRGAVFTAVLVRKEKPLRPPGLEDSIWDLLVSTWAYAPSERLNIMQLVSSLEPYGHPFSSYPNFTPDPRYLTVGWTDWTGYLTAGEPISAGGFSEVHEGKWTDIAIEKRLSVRHVVIEISRRRGGPAPKADFKVSKRMLREVDAYSRIHHKNIVSFLGIIYLRPDSEISLVFEFAEKGTLLKYLEDNPKANRYSYLKDLAHAIDYIHSLTPGVIHGSITGRQLLVKGDGTLLLGGFGLSKVTEDVSSWETSVSNAGGDVRWMAPEVLSGVVAHASAATDTYAFGMTIVEILTGRVPFFNLRRESEVIVVVVVRNERPTRPHGMPNWLWSIACRCWAEDPDSRPRMSEVVRLFDASLAEWQDG